MDKQKALEFLRIFIEEINVNETCDGVLLIPTIKEKNFFIMEFTNDELIKIKKQQEDISKTYDEKAKILNEEERKRKKQRYERPCAYCRLHKKSLSINDLKGKKCIPRECWHLRKDNSHPYWKEREVQKVLKRIGKKERKIELCG